jgi:hypothetical protein
VVDPRRLRRLTDALRSRVRQVGGMTFIWFVVWLVADEIGAHEPLLLNPVNGWTATLILAIALDLGRSGALPGKRRS